MNKNQKKDFPNNIYNLFFPHVEPFENAQLSSLEDDYKNFVVDPATRLKDMALQNKMEYIDNEIFIFDASLNEQLSSLNTKIQGNNNHFQDNLEIKLTNLRSNNSSLEQKYKQNLINSHAAKSSYRNERTLYRKNLVQSFVYGSSLLYMGLLMYRAFK